MVTLQQYNEYEKWLFENHIQHSEENWQGWLANSLQELVDCFNNPVENWTK